MTVNQALYAIRNGGLVTCTKEEYGYIRTALQDFASQRIDLGDHLRAQIALDEVKRLDKAHGFNPFAKKE